MKRILLIATGGTIASGDTGDGMEPVLKPEDVLHYLPSVKELCEVECLKLYDLDSTNVGPEHWLGMAETVEKQYDKFDGFIILHGTDTMAYTAAALSYLIQNAGKPIVITGAQKPISMEVTDAKRNLYDSFLYAVSEGAYGVSIVFDGHVIAGTRARKTRSKSFNAFSSIDFPDLAVIRGERVVRYIRDKKPEGQPKFFHKLCRRVFVLKLIPGLDAGMFEYLREHYDALIIESFGMGGIPCYDNDDFMAAIEDWMARGKTLVITTQVSHEGSDMSIYHVGVRVREQFEVLECYDMTPEATLTKLMWILGETQEHARVKELFYTPVGHDLLEE